MKNKIETTEKSSAENMHSHDSQDSQDACDIEFGDAEQTSDEDLPVSTGGVA